MSEKYSDGVKAVLGLLKQLKHDGVFYIINADGPRRIEIADDVDDGLSEIKAALNIVAEIKREGTRCRWQHNGKCGMLLLEGTTSWLDKEPSHEA